MNYRGVRVHYERVWTYFNDVLAEADRAHPGQLLGELQQREQQERCKHVYVQNDSRTMQAPFFIFNYIYYSFKPPYFNNIKIFSQLKFV